MKLEPRWNYPVLEKLTILSAFLLIFEPFYRNSSQLGASIWFGLVSLALALNLYRLVNWRFFAAFQVKVLFILYIAYSWLPVHFALSLAGDLGWISQVGRPALHSLASGAMGIMILGIVHRVALGHTGRKIHASPLAVFAYLMIVVGSLARVFGPLFVPEYYFFWLRTSGSLWTLAFLLIAVEIVPILLAPRFDGK